MLPILASLVASSQKFSSVTSSRLFFLGFQRFPKISDIQFNQCNMPIFNDASSNPYIWIHYAASLDKSHLTHYVNPLTSIFGRDPQQLGLGRRQRQFLQLLQISSKPPGGRKIKPRLLVTEGQWTRQGPRLSFWFVNRGTAMLSAMNTFTESPNSLTSIDFELSQSKMRNAQLHLTWKSWKKLVLEN